MLEQLLRHLRNWFVVPGGIHSGRYIIEKGSLVLPFLRKGQYFRIIGSVLNDGVHEYPAEYLTDEAFDGTVWALAVPAEVLRLEKDIRQWADKNPESGCTSESFGGYSYTRPVNAVTGQAAAWQDVFRSRLNQWRKV